MTDSQKTGGTQEDAVEPVQAPTDPVEGTGEAEPGSGPESEDSGDTFSREYVETLRAEAATHRVAAKRAEAFEVALRAATIREAAGPVLQDVDDLAWSDDFIDEESGLPSAELIRAAAEELADRKPHLARVRGDIGQGRHSETTEEFSLAGALRQNA